MISPIGVSGDLPTATARTAISRSVIIPTSRSFSLTGSAPASISAIMRAAWRMVSPGLAMRTSCVMASLTFMAQSFQGLATLKIRSAPQAVIAAYAATPDRCGGSPASVRAPPPVKSAHGARGDAGRKLSPAAKTHGPRYDEAASGQGWEPGEINGEVLLGHLVAHRIQQQAHGRSHQVDRQVLAGAAVGRRRIAGPLGDELEGVG